MRSSFVRHLQEPDSELVTSFDFEVPPLSLIHQFFKNVGSWEIFVLLTQLVRSSLPLQHSIVIVNQGLHHLTRRHIGISIVVTYVLKIRYLRDAPDCSATNSSNSFRQSIDGIER